MRTTSPFALHFIHRSFRTSAVPPAPGTASIWWYTEWDQSTSLFCSLLTAQALVHKVSGQEPTSARVAAAFRSFAFYSASAKHVGGCNSGRRDRRPPVTGWYCTVVCDLGWPWPAITHVCFTKPQRNIYVIEDRLILSKVKIKETLVSGDITPICGYKRVCVCMCVDGFPGKVSSIDSG